MKKVIIFIIAISLAVIFSGCFDVERNNPFDPDSDLPDSEKMVTVKGFTYRGYSDQILPNVEVTIGGKTTVSDSGGYYSIDLMPGTHNLRATLGGWMEMNYQINVKATATAIATQHEDISMFIWYEYWEAYEPLDIPGLPWAHDGQITGYSWINANYYLELGVNNALDAGDYSSTWAASWPNKPTVINNILIGLRFSNVYIEETYQGFRIEDAMAREIFSVYFFMNELYVNSPMVSSIVASSSITERDIFVEFRVNTNNRKKGIIYFYNRNGELIFVSANVEYDEDFKPDWLFFNIHDWAGGTGVQGTMQVLFIEFF